MTDSFTESFDARDWAKAFIETNRKHHVADDEGAMMAWFANALMRGYDERARRQAASGEDQKEPR